VRIAYLLYWTLSTGRGVVKKVAGQARAWKQAGHNVSLYIVGRDLDVLASDLCPDATHLFPADSLRKRMNAWREAGKLLALERPDIVYFRYDLYVPGMEGIFRIAPVVVEINTNDLREFCLQGPLRCLYNRIFRSRILNPASGFVVVTSELERLVGLSGKPVVVIGNGIDLTRYSCLPPSTEPTYNLVFLGTPGQAWHGLEVITLIAAAFPSWLFHVVGYSALPGFPPNVIFYGYLREGEYEEILRRADVGLGTFGLEKKSMTESSSLKVREYLARGLPVITGSRDTDFPGGAEFLLYVSKEHLAAELPKIEAFVSRWKGKRVPRELVQHLDWRVKERRRLAFFAEVIALEVG